MIVNKRGLSEVLGVSERTLTEWQKEGLPVHFRAERGGENQYETAAVIKWHCDRQLQKANQVSAKDRLDNLRADEIEVRMAKDAGNLLDALEVEQLWTSLITAARVDLLNFADDLKASLREKGFDPSGLAIDSELEAILERLANQEQPEYDDESIESEPEEGFSDDA